MTVPIYIPKLGMTMEFANLVEWKGKEGDWIEKGSVVLAIETEKVSFEVEAVGSGYLHIIVEKGNKAKVGAVAGLLCETKEELAEVQKDHPTGAAQEVKAAPAAAAVPVAAKTPKKEGRKRFLLSGELKFTGKLCLWRTIFT